MLKKVFYIMAGLSLAFLSSCTPIYYDTNTGGGIDRQADNSTVYDTVKLTLQDTSTWGGTSSSNKITGDGSYTFICDAADFGWGDKNFCIESEGSITASIYLQSSSSATNWTDTHVSNVSIAFEVYYYPYEGSAWVQIPCSLTGDVTDVYVNEGDDDNPNWVDSGDNWVNATFVNPWGTDNITASSYNNIKMSKIKVIATFSGID